MLGVKIRKAPLLMQIEDVWNGRSQRESRSVIERTRESVRALHRKIVTEALVDLDLQRIITGDGFRGDLAVVPEARL